MRIQVEEDGVGLPTTEIVAIEGERVVIGWGRCRYIEGPRNIRRLKQRVE